jgi:hypothetical protein
MFQFNHNGFIFMDVTFGTNNVKYHLFTLTTFDFHRTRVVATLTLGSRLKQGLARLQAKREALESHLMLP